MSKVYLLFTDHEGDPLALTNEITAVYVAGERETLRSFPGREIKTSADEKFRVVHHPTGSYRVSESFEEVMAKIEVATACE